MNAGSERRAGRTAWKIATLLTLAGAAMAWSERAEAQEFLRGPVVVFEEALREFELPTPQCLEYCVEITYEETKWECAPQLAPPTDGCDLPWIDPSSPTPDPFGQGLRCVPPEAEFAGYGLLEDNALVVEKVHHRANCTSTRKVRRVPRANTGNRPARDCPDDRGPWVETQRTLPTIKFVPCSP